MSNRTDAQKAKLLSEMRSLSVLAKEAREKTPKLLLVAVERASNPSITDANANGEEIGSLLQLVSMVSDYARLKSSMPDPTVLLRLALDA